MEILSNGNTIMAYEEASNHSDNTDDQIHLRFSDDKGATWTAEDTDLDGNPVSVGFPPGATLSDAYGPGGTYIWQAPNDDIWLHCWKADYDAPDMLGGWRCKSTDGGLTWSAWAQLTISGQTAGENNNTIFEEVHFVYDGDVYAICRVYDVYWSTVKGIFIKSTDEGTTWTKISDLSDYSDATHEFAAEYFGSNVIKALARDAGNARSMRIPSGDFGSTWGDIVYVESAIGVIGRNRMWTVDHIQGNANWWLDNRVIMIGFILTNPGSSLGRRNAVWTSVDSGDSWNGPQWLDEGTEDAGYGDLIYDPDTDTYRVVTYQGSQATADLVQYDFEVNW